MIKKMDDLIRQSIQFANNQINYFLDYRLHASLCLRGLEICDFCDRPIFDISLNDLLIHKANGGHYVSELLLYTPELFCCCNVDLFRLKKRQPGSVYVFQISGDHNAPADYKIGYTSKIVKMRSQQVARQFGGQVTTITKFNCDDVLTAEYKLHLAFESCNIDGEWFNLSDSDIKKIKTISGYLKHSFTFNDERT